MSLLLIASERFAEHQTPPGHPERSERAEVMEAAAVKWRSNAVDVAAPILATDEQLARVHEKHYLALIDGTAGRAVALDPDTYTSPESSEIARLAAGAAIVAVEHVLKDRAPGGPASGADRSEAPLRAAFALVRPPGHHAERDRAMGFCLYNNVAVAAAHARALGVERVAIVDYDVHHGNGTQHTFEHDSQVLYVSLHQFPFYPGTGAVHEIGKGEGQGFTVNLPLEAGAVDDDYRAAFADVVVPVLRQFRPSLLLVSAGFDAHERDPLAGMRLSTGSYAAMTRELTRVAVEAGEGRMVLVTEGGYDLRALAGSLDGVIGALSSPSEEAQWPAGGVSSTRGRRAVDASRRALASFWKFD